MSYPFWMKTLLPVHPCACPQAGMQTRTQRWLFLLAIVFDVWVSHSTQVWGLSGSHHAGFLSASLLCLAILPKNGKSDWAWLIALWVLLCPLRGGLLASVLTLGFPALLSTAMASILSLTLWTQLYLHRQSLHPFSRQCALAVSYIVLLRLVYLGLPELIFEEAYYWDYAQHLDYGYLDHPLVTALIIKAFTVVLGNHMFAVRLGAFCCWFITGYYVFKLSKQSLSATQAPIALLLAAALPAYFFFGFFMSPDAPLTACWAAALYFIYRILRHKQASAWYGLAISLGIGMSSKYTIALLGLGLVALLIADQSQRGWWLRKEPYLALLVVLALFSPVVIWNALHDWASFTFQSEERAKSGFVFSTPRFIGNVLLFATPIGALSFWAIVLNLHRIKTALSLTYAHAAEDIKALMQLTWLGVFPIALFACLSVARTSKLNWTGPCWLALIPLFTLLISRQPLFSQGLLRTCQRAWPAMIALLLLVYGAGLQYLSIGYPGVPYPQNTHLLGWQPAGAAIERLAQTHAQQTGKKVWVVGMDRNRIASGLAFYRAMAQVDTPLVNANHVTQAAYSTTSQNLFGDNGLMFAWWFHKTDVQGGTLLLVSDDQDDLHAPRVLQHSREQGEVHRLPTFKNGQPTGTLYYRFVADYQP